MDEKKRLCAKYQQDRNSIDTVIRTDILVIHIVHQQYKLVHDKIIYSAYNIIPSRYWYNTTTITTWSINLESKHAKI